MKVLANVIHYLARGLAILIAAFFSVFILEGFDPAFGWQSGVAHAIPAAFAITLVVVAHMRPKLGGWLYIAAGLGFIGLVALTSPMAKAGTAQFLLLLSNMAPLTIFICGIGVLFLLDAHWTAKDKRHAVKDGS